MPRKNWTNAEEMIVASVNAYVKKQIEERSKIRSDARERNDDEVAEKTYTPEEATSVLNRLREDLEGLGNDLPQLATGPSLDKEKLEEFISNPSLLTQEDWLFIKKLRTDLEEKKKGQDAEESEEEAYVEKEREKAEKKHLNVREGWWPL